jgi:hypothetical protein
MPGGLSDLIMRLLSKDREARPASARAVAEALRELEGTQPTTQVVAARTVAPSRLPRRRFLISLLAIAGTAAVIAGFVLWRPWASAPPAPEKPIANAAATFAPLQVQKLCVLLWKESPKKVEGPFEFGSDAFPARFGDPVLIKVEFREPVYFFLLAFNPDGEEQLCWPTDPRQPPERQDRLDYPQGDDMYFRLNDGEGLQAFVLLASRRPLPAYEAWKAQRPVPVWRKLSAKAGAAWRGDGQSLQRVTRGGDERGEPVKLKLPRADTVAEETLVELGKQLRQAPGIEALAVAAFAVLPPNGEK